MRQKAFGLETIKKSATRDIEEYRKDLGLEPNIFVDSGGYSILAGDIPFGGIRKAIECYNWVLENVMPNHGDYIFSLDIPIFLKEPQYNNVPMIKEVNQRSLKGSLNILEKIPSLYDKFIFVWQFKIAKQYKIWCELYEEYFKNNQQLKHFAIGGMVGLRGIVPINFSPFLPLAFKCAYELFRRNDRDETSIIHMLGVYHLHDRFAMAFLHRLFNELYFKHSKRKIQVTYDTVNYMLSGLYNVRELNMMMFNDDDIYNLKPDQLLNKLDQISSQKDIQDILKTDLERINKGEPLINPAMTGLINIVHNINLDKVFDHVVMNSGIVEAFLKYCSRPTTLRPQLLPLFLDLEKKYPQAFKNRTYKNLENFEWIRKMHVWWMKGRKENILESAIYQFINDINFPADLSEV